VNKNQESTLIKYAHTHTVINIKSQVSSVRQSYGPENECIATVLLVRVPPQEESFLSIYHQGLIT
jgi:hypothetical protein